MNFTVTSETNFCRIFQCPANYSEQFCFGGPIPHAFLMVDWFNAVPTGMPSVQEREYPFEITIQELHDLLVPWLKKKPYIRPGYTYLVLCDFGAAFTFSKGDTK